MDYDLVSNIQPIVGTAAAATMDGSVYTAAVDTSAYPNRSVTFVAVMATAVSYTATTGTVQDSPDNSTWTDVDSSLLVRPVPTSPATTSRIHTIGYMGKQRYVKAAIDNGSASAGQITTILGHPTEMPLFKEAITGIEG